MKAVVLQKPGPENAVIISSDWPKPDRKKGELLIKVLRFGLNQYEAKQKRGDLPKSMFKLPKILGSDFCGSVVETDPGSKFQVGQIVFGFSDGVLPSDPSGTYAEYTSVKEDLAVPVPPGLSIDEAGGLGMVSATAWQALEWSMPLKDKLVLVHAGAGGVGSCAMQIAKAQGATVATTCSGKNMELVRTLGADVVFDYTKEKFEEAAKKQGLMFDVVVDGVGGDYEWRSRSVLKRSGHYTNLIASGYQRTYGKSLFFLYAIRDMVLGKIRQYLFFGPRYNFLSASNRADRGVKQVAQLVTDGKFKLLMDKVVPFDEVLDALEYVGAEKARGKVVVRMAD